MCAGADSGPVLPRARRTARGLMTSMERGNDSRTIFNARADFLVRRPVPLLGDGQDLLLAATFGGGQEVILTTATSSTTRRWRISLRSHSA